MSSPRRGGHTRAWYNRGSNFGPSPNTQAASTLTTSTGSQSNVTSSSARQHPVSTSAPATTQVLPSGNGEGLTGGFGGARRTHATEPEYTTMEARFARQRLDTPPPPESTVAVARPDAQVLPTRTPARDMPQPQEEHVQQTSPSTVVTQDGSTASIDRSGGKEQSLLGNKGDEEAPGQKRKRRSVSREVDDYLAELESTDGTTSQSELGGTGNQGEVVGDEEPVSHAQALADRANVAGAARPRTSSARNLPSGFGGPFRSPSPLPPLPGADPRGRLATTLPSSERAWDEDDEHFAHNTEWGKGREDKKPHRSPIVERNRRG